MSGLDDVTRALLMRATRDSLMEAWLSTGDIWRMVTPIDLHDEVDAVVRERIETMQDRSEAMAMLALMGVITATSHVGEALTVLAMEYSGKTEVELGEEVKLKLDGFTRGEG